MKIRFACVKWIDAECDGGWHSADDVAADRVAVVHSAGWIAHDGPERITLAQGVALDEHDNPHWCGLFHIPRAMVRSVKFMRDPR